MNASRVGIVLSLVALFAFDLTGIFAADYILTSFVDQNSEISGAVDYDISLVMLPQTDNVTLVSPAGSRFAGSILTVEGIAGDSLNAEYSGAWTIEESSSNGDVDRYHFTMPELLTPDSFPPAPVITFPQDGDILGPTFEVGWTGSLEGSCGVGYRITGYNGPRPDVECLGESARVTFPENADLSEAEMTVTASNELTEFGILLPVEPLTASASSTFEIGGLSWHSNSIPITLTFVPEPTYAFSSAIILLVMVSLYRRAHDLT